MAIRKGAVENVERGRRGRGLGPFTSGHLTIIVVTLVVVVGFPFAAFAVTGNNVFITDPGSGQHAGVDAKHNVDTAIHDPVTGKAATVDASGNLQTKLNGGSVGITGSVTAPQAAPGNMFVAVGAAFTGANNCNFFTPKPGFAAVITSIDEYTSNATTANPLVASFDVATVTDCSATGTEITEDRYVSDAPHTVSLGAGIGVAAGHHLSLWYQGPEGAAVTATVFGYYVPAAQCSSGCL